MEIAQLPVELIVTQGIFAVLFVWLFFDSRKEAKEREEEAKEREDRLVRQLTEQNITQSRIVQSLERLETQVSNLQGGIK